MVIGTSVGVWLFYVQHNFEGTYWERHKDWDFFKAGLTGSSFYKLPLILQWFTGNIGFHHIHHLTRAFPTISCQKLTARIYVSCASAHASFQSALPAFEVMG